MKLVTWQLPGEAQAGTGVLLQGHQQLLDLKSADKLLDKRARPFMDSVLAIVENGDKALEQIASLLEQAERSGLEEALRPLTDVRLLAPLPHPPRLRCFSVYEQHMKQSMDAVVRNKGGRVLDALNKRLGVVGVPKSFYRKPTYYKGNHLAVVGPDANVMHPRGVTQLDYELEMAMVVGRRGKDICCNDAESYIFGFCCFNDFSARDLLIRDILSGIGPQKGKDFDTSNALGPWLVTKDEIADPYNLKMEVRVNGVVKGQSNTGTMYHSMSAMIEWASFNETIVPGEIFATGAAGNGCGIERWEFIGIGDVVEIEVEGLGILRNRVVGPSQRLLAQEQVA